MYNGKEIKVLIVDDSSVVRQMLELGLNSYNHIKVTGKARDVYEARDLIVKNKPDVVTLDVEMPKMNGVDFLKRLMPQYPVPVIMVSSMTSQNSKITIEALEAGALDFVLKPGISNENAFKDMLDELVTKIRAVAFTDLSNYKDPNFQIHKVKQRTIPNRKIQKIIVIGASTGGTVATKRVLKMLPENSPGIIITQHMPAGFTAKYASSIKETTHFDAKEAQDNDKIEKGKVLIAPGDYHIKIIKQNGYYFVKKIKSEKVNGHRPSVDVLFNSAAECAGKNVIGVLLTGMGKDGAKGLLNIKNHGGKTIAQDEESSIVYGMPAEALKLGAVYHGTHIGSIPNQIVNALLEDEKLASQIEQAGNMSKETK